MVTEQLNKDTCVVRNTGSTGVGAGTFGNANRVMAVTRTVVIAAAITAVRTTVDFIANLPNNNSSHYTYVSKCLLTIITWQLALTFQ